MKTILLVLNVLMMIYIIYLTTPMLFEVVGESGYSNETQHVKGTILLFIVYIVI